MSAAPQIGDIIKFEIEIIKGPHSGQKYTFEKSSVIIGRGTENDIILDKDPRVSRQHVEIKQSMGEFYLVNLSQRNFVMLNGETVTSEKMPSEATLQVGDCELKFKAEVQEKSQEAVAVVAPIIRQQVVPTPPPQAPQMPTSLPPMNPYAMPNSGPRPSQQNPFMGTGPSRQQMNQQGDRTRFYVIIGVIAVVLFFLLNSAKKNRMRTEEAFRSSEKVQQDMIEADAAIETLKERSDKLNSLQYRRAQENFIKAFRDFRDGQYGRARDAFQVVLNLDPDNELAKRYYNLAKIKFDEQVKFGIVQGHRYREKNNFRMCASSFLNVMNMLQNNRNDPSFMEAEKFYKECQLGVEGRY